MAPLLSDEQVKEIERQRRDGVKGPVVLAWVDRLLEDRRERVRQLEHVRQRLRQAFRYLDSLLAHPAADAAHAARKPSGPVVCPLCGKPYVRAFGISPRGIGYEHTEGRHGGSDLSAGRCQLCSDNDDTAMMDRHRLHRRSTLAPSFGAIIAGCCRSPRTRRACRAAGRAARMADCSCSMVPRAEWGNAWDGDYW